MLLIAGLLAGCFDPHPQAGTACPTGACPSPLVCSPATRTCEREATDAAVERIDSGGDATDLPSFSELSGQQWLMPCAAAPNPNLCDCSDVTTRVTVGGRPDVTYKARVRIRGIMERGTYAGGTAQGTWYVGGTTTSTFLTVAELSVTQPAQHYFLNTVNGMGLAVLDYEAILSITGGAEVTLFMSALDARETANGTMQIPGVMTMPSPYLGQFAQIDVLEVTAAP